MHRQEWPDPDRYVAMPRKPPDYRSAKGRARVAVWLLILVIAAHLAIAVLGFVNVALLTSAIGNPADVVDLVERRDSLVTVGVILFWAATIPAAIGFMVWMTRTYANVEALAPGYKRHWTGWAWLGWIVPIMNLFRPKQIVNDIWRASAHEVPGWVLGWWLLWLGTGIANRVLSRIPADNLQQFRWFDGVDAVLSLVIAAAGLLAIRLVRRTTALQEEHASRPKPPEADRDERIERDADPHDGFTIEPAWAPSDSR